ncbi:MULTISPECIES: phosphorylase family protein [unclassified Nitrospina]|uniref:phosphorylase family protein n=1 Tax=unclassified Nitrospina TaxID=2638683 RepID=UPI003F962B44
MEHHLCIIGAIREEIAGIKGRMRIDESLKLNGASAFIGTWEGFRLVLVRSGVGRRRAAKAFQQVCDHFPLVQVISIGFAGGLDPALQVGDLLIADTITMVCDGAAVTTESMAIPVALVNQAMVVACPEGATAYQGTLVTVDDVVSHPDDKKKLGKTHGALGVDMETFELAKEAERRDVPFLSVRAITDTAGQTLMNCSHLVDDDGNVSTLKAGWHVLTHPGDLTGMIELGKHARLATAHLTSYLKEYLHCLK